MRFLHDPNCIKVFFGCDIENTAQRRSFENKNINITHCIFSRSIIISGDGGVIKVNGGSYQTNVNNSMFFNCLANYG